MAGDGFALVRHVRHCTAAEALALVRDVVMPSSGGRGVRRLDEPAGPANDAPEREEGEEIEAHRNAPRGTPDMLYGIFGDIGRIAADGTEANPYAACMNAMVFFSACVGREVYLRIGKIGRAHV